MFVDEVLFLVPSNMTQWTQYVDFTLLSLSLPAGMPTLARNYYLQIAGWWQETLIAGADELLCGRSTRSVLKAIINLDCTYANVGSLLPNVLRSFIMQEYCILKYVLDQTQYLKIGIRSKIWSRSLGPFIFISSLGALWPLGGIGHWTNWPVQ